MSTIGFIVLMVIQISLLIDISSSIRQIDEREHEKQMLENEKLLEEFEKEKENETN